MAMGVRSRTLRMWKDMDPTERRECILPSYGENPSPAAQTLVNLDWRTTVISKELT